MKFTPDYRKDFHRENIEKMGERHLTMEGQGFEQVDAVLYAARHLFDLPYDCKEEMESIKNLILYISKRHTHNISRRMKQKEYNQFISEGHTTYRDKNGKKVYNEEADFEAGHELPHYLVAYLINSKYGVNNNSVFPSYVTDLQQQKTELNKEGVRRDYSEEVYATAISFGVYESNLVVEMGKNGYRDIPFDQLVISVFGQFLENEHIMALKYTELDKSKVDRDYEVCKERLLEVVTATEEERQTLIAKYPLECFAYDLCYAYRYGKQKDSKAVWGVFQKYFSRLFEKANANPGVYQSPAATHR